jgi:hypothetical protein
MLNILRNKAQKEEVKPVLYEQYMQELKTDSLYKTIFIPLSTFMLLTELKDAIEALQRFYSHLEKDGELIITLFVPRDEMMANQNNIWKFRKEGVLLETYLESMKLRWYYKHEFTMMLEKVGFENITVNYGYNSNETSDKSFMIFTAKK